MADNNNQFCEAQNIVTQNESTKAMKSYYGFDFDRVGTMLEEELRGQLDDFYFLEEQRKNIKNPENLGETIKNVIWAQFINQIGVNAGEDFIAENGGNTLDLKEEAHLFNEQKLENQKTPLHNQRHEYEQRIKDFHDNFERKDGEIQTHTNTRTGKIYENVDRQKRTEKFDKDRPRGNKENHTAMDHTVSAAELMRNRSLYAYLDEKEIVTFANSPINLQEMDAAWNQSKSDLSMREWLEKPNANGQKPEEIWNITPEQKEILIKRDEEARTKLNELISKGKEKAIQEARQSQKAEALRIGKDALKAALMGMLAQLIRKIISKFVQWLKDKNRNIGTLIDKIKEAFVSFVKDIKGLLTTAGDTFVTAVATAICGPIIGIMKKIWIVLQQSGRSILEAIRYLKKPENRMKPSGVLMMEAGKIVTAGFAAAGAIALSGVIETSLLSIPVFAIQIPLIGSLASIIGVFAGGVISGILGALVINIIDSLIARTQIQEITKQKVDKLNMILATQDKKMAYKKARTMIIEKGAYNKIDERHAEIRVLLQKTRELRLSSGFGSALPEHT